MDSVTSFFRNTLVVFALFAVPSILFALAYVPGDARVLLALPVVPFITVMFALRIYVSYSLEEPHAFAISFLAVLAFCSLLAAVHARRPTLAKLVAIVVGIVNALLILTLARYFA
jgi:hypothetical protein